MIKKYLFIAFAIISISIVSCRQDDEMVKIENDNLKSKIDSVENSTFKKIDDSVFSVITSKDPEENSAHSIFDSILMSTDPNDPPKSGTHFKVIDSLIIIKH